MHGQIVPTLPRTCANPCDIENILVLTLIGNSFILMNLACINEFIYLLMYD